jgi:hypothetical protein
LLPFGVVEWNFSSHQAQAIKTSLTQRCLEKLEDLEPVLVLKDCLRDWID